MVLPRFSRLALGAVATLVATGTFMAWREVGSVNALTATTFGRVLLVKLLSDGMHGNAALGSPGDAVVAAGQGAALVRGLIAETTIAFGVLAVTAALVVIVPAR